MNLQWSFILYLTDILYEISARNIPNVDSLSSNTEKFKYYIITRGSDDDEKSIAEKLGFTNNKEKTFIRLKFNYAQFIINEFYEVESKFYETNRINAKLLYNNFTKTLSVCEFLILRDQNSKIWEIVNNIELQVIKHSFTILILQCLSLRLDILPNFKIYNKKDVISSIFDEIEKYQLQFKHENFLRLKHLELRDLINDKGEKNEVDKLESFIDEYYKNQIQGNESFEILKHFYAIKIEIALFHNNFDQVEENSRKAISQLRNNIQYDGEFDLINLKALLALNKYDNIVIDEITRAENYNKFWFDYNQINFIVQVRKKEFGKCLETKNTVIRHKFFRYQNDKTREQWEVNEAFVNIFIKLGFLPVDIQKNKFTLPRFMNSVPNFTKEKDSHNITNLIIQFTLLILDRKYDKIIDKRDSLIQYNFRYLKRDKTFRSTIFVRMILQLIKADFHPIRAERYVETLRKKLLESKNLIDNNVEIFEYDLLWDEIIKYLKMNTKK